MNKAVIQVTIPHWRAKVLRLAACVVLLTLPSLSEAQERPQHRVIVDHVQVRVPATRDGIGETLYDIASHTGVLFGFETVAEPRETGPSPRLSTFNLKGMTVSQALDALASFDPRYSWREVEGVLNFRPKAAFDDPRHFLNKRVEAFGLDHAVPLEATFAVHRLYRPDCEVRHPVFTSRRQDYLKEQPVPEQVMVSVKLKNVTVLDILNAVVKAHGTLHWKVTYANGPARYENSKFAFGAYPLPGGWWRMCVGDERR